MRTLRVSLLSLALLAAAPAGFTPYLVKDINPEATPASSEPRAFMTLGDLAIFQVSRVGQTELWRTDGTASGTYRLAETGYLETFANTGGLLFFRTQDADSRWRLWVTDGTLPGTFSLVETSGYWTSTTAAWVPAQGALYFTSDPGQGHGVELWRSDGTPGGTHEVLDIVPGPVSSNPYFLTSFQGRVWFSAGGGLWQSDGTPQGTLLVKEVPAASLHVVGPRLFFLGSDDRGFEPWASDGTAAGTRRIADLAKGAASPEYQDFLAVGKRLFFTAAASAERGQELYVTDGTAQGTRALTSFSDPYALEWLSRAALGNRLLFAARNRTNGLELWSSNGTAKGTRLVLDACPGACPSNPLFFLQHQGRLYYQANDGTHGPELWVTDGTAQGTRMVKDVCPGECGSWPSAVSASGGRLYFTTRNDNQYAISLWATDGTEQGTVALAQLPDFFVQGATAGGSLVFSGADPGHGQELWCSDGTPEGTHLLADVADEDVGGSDPHGLVAMGESALFFARDPDAPGLWKSDGTAQGTVRVKPGLAGRGPLTASASRIFFHAYPRQGSSELWTSDGSEAGTLRVSPDGVRALGALSQPVIKLGSRVFFSGWTMEHGSEPWITDGTRAGTRRVADLRPGAANSSPRDFTVFAGRAFFVARFRLWKSDGTRKGTVALGPELREIQPRTAYAGKLWFTGRNSRWRTELWATDGTAARTVRIAELKTVAGLTVHAGRLWFLGSGTELWSTDGTAAGTRKLDLPAWPHQPFGGIVSDGLRLYLTDFERALWVSDGTAGGTRKISGQGATGPAIGFAGRLWYVSPSWDLYTSDGTEAGTGPVQGPRQVVRLLRFGDRLVLITYGGEVWQSDGTNMMFLRDLSPATYPSPEVVKAGPRLFFPGWDEETGWELWAMRE